jgi:general secretion pathway protein G
MASASRIGSTRGFTMVELTVVALVVTVLAAIAVPTYVNFINRARSIRAAAEIRALDKEIMMYKVNESALPETLAALGESDLSDPWGNPYRYVNASLSPGRMRLDQFSVLLNTDYDLYSAGVDGESEPSLDARESWDDIVRAGDGGYFGPAASY